MREASANDQTDLGIPWGLLILLTVFNVFNFVDRQLLASFANFIKPELGLTDSQFGLLTGFFFLIFYATAGLFTGMLADRMHRPRLIAGAVALWSLLTAASGLAKGFISLAIPRAFIGIGESALAPSAMSLLADRVPAAKMGLAAGFYYMGVPIGAGLSLLIAGYLGPVIGWRNCFFALGILGLVFAAAMLLVRDPRPKREAHDVPGFWTQLGQVHRALRQSPALIATMVGGVSVHIAVGAAQFDQLWFVQERGFDKAEIAQITGYLTVLGGVVGNLAGGILGDWWQHRMGSGRPMLLFWMLLLLSPFALLYRIVPADSPLLFIGVVVGIFQLSAFYGPTFSTVQELAPASARGTVTAFYILCLNVIGLGIGITVTGLLVDALRGSGVDQPYSVAMLVATIVSMIALPSFFLAGRWFDRDKQRMVAG